MLNNPTELSKTDAQSQNTTKVTQKQKLQHGIHHIRCPILLDVPVETLTGITSYLNPISLLALAQVNKYLNEHVKNDNTWRRALLYQFLGIGPESDLDEEKTLLLRRAERSWRSEFITRYRLRKRWERSRNVTTSHVPVHSVISGMHLMPSNALLTSSIEYGIVARSLPLTGKILSGYLDASGIRAGLGIGNPNAEFTPNVSACAMSSEGGTAKIAWGSRAGDVLFTNAPRALETGRRSAADIRRCDVVDEHDGAVLDIKWDQEYVATGGADGRVKLWNAKTVSCLWTSEQVLKTFIPDACVKIATSILHGYVVAVFRSGDIHVWTGVNVGSSLSEIIENVVPNPTRTTTVGYDSDAPHDIVTLDVDPSCPTPTFLVAYQNDPFFYRIQIKQQVNVTAFGDPNFRSMSLVVPFFKSDTLEQSIVLVGDHIGCISLYAWDSNRIHPTTNSVAPKRKFEALADGASITAIAWNGITLIAGSVRGTTHVFDGLTFAPLRSFTSPVPRLRAAAGHALTAEQARERQMVRHIIVSPNKEVMFVGVGDRVMAWHAGPVPKHTAGGVRGRHTSGVVGKKKRSGNAKYLEQVEMKETISESRHLLQERSTQVKRAYGREREQHAELNTLGLSEVEAVEYVLMLSRDEVNSNIDIDEGVFEGDFDEDDPDFDDNVTTVGSRGSSRRPSTSTTTGSSSSIFGGPRLSPSASSGSASSGSTASGRSSGTNRTRAGRPIPNVGPSSSNEKVQISPPYRAEPLEAGQEYQEGEDALEGTRMHLDDHYFPPISPSGSPGVGSGTRITSVSPKGKETNKGKKSKTKASSSTPSSSPKSVKSSASGSPSAWSPHIARKATTSTTVSPPSSAPRTNAWAKGPGLSRISPPTPRTGNILGSSVQIPRHLPSSTSAPVRSLPADMADDEALMDADLRFALELSLVEARSRAEDA